MRITINLKNEKDISVKLSKREYPELTQHLKNNFIELVEVEKESSINLYLKFSFQNKEHCKITEVGNYLLILEKLALTIQYCNKRGRILSNLMNKL